MAARFSIKVEKKGENYLCYFKYKAKAIIFHIDKNEATPEYMGIFFSIAINKLLSGK